MELKLIRQKDRYSFLIEWTDGKISYYRLADLQRHCPCARCKRQSKESCEEVEATRVVSVGRYGLQVFFTKGCSKGIYPFGLLREIGQYAR